MPVAVCCLNCGQEFMTAPHEARWRKYCSRECKTAHNSVELRCVVCGKLFRRLKSQLPEGGGKYCSYACKDSARRKPAKQKAVREPVFKVCKTCGGTFRVPPVRKDTAKYCSRKCAAANLEFRRICSESQSGEKSWRWTGGKYKRGTGYIRVKKKTLGVEITSSEHRIVMVEWMLSECPGHPFLLTVEGRTVLHPEIEVHHKDRVRGNNTRDNLLAVTKHAHAAIHHYGRRPDPWECWPPNPINW